MGLKLVLKTVCKKTECLKPNLCPALSFFLRSFTSLELFLLTHPITSLSVFLYSPTIWIFILMVCSLCIIWTPSSYMGLFSQLPHWVCSCTLPPLCTLWTPLCYINYLIGCVLVLLAGVEEPLLARGHRVPKQIRVRNKTWIFVSIQKRTVQ